MVQPVEFFNRLLSAATGGADFFERRGKFGGDGRLLADDVAGFVEVGAQIEQCGASGGFARVWFAAFFRGGGGGDVFPGAFADGETTGVLDQCLAALLRFAEERGQGVEAVESRVCGELLPGERGKGSQQVEL